MLETNLPTTDTVVKTTATYARDLAERVIWTFLGAAGAVALAGGPADMLHVSFWEGAGTAGLAAAVALVKGIAARAIGAKNSASTAAGV
ncbi:hypothetical protein ABZV65_14000 [Streptomyces bauhiniae]|uniref:hypothetical protein n=1 Tax=Streptomyces bauhiniae TaxID=2340725 RepID=UPI0033B96A1B